MDINDLPSDAPPAPKPAPPAVEVATAASTPLEALDAWFDGNIRDSAYSRNTQVYNQILSAVVSIKTAMAGVEV